MIRTMSPLNQKFWLLAAVAVLAANPVFANEPSQQIEEHIAAGEFQSALEIAEGTKDVASRTALFKQIADAQLAAGEFDAAGATTRRIPDTQERIRQRSRNATSQSLAGTGADFDALIELIQNETSGPWEEIEGVGGTISEFETGVRVDPNGLLGSLTKSETSNRLKQLNLKARKASLNEDMNQSSRLRMVSLKRLEEAVAEQIADGQPVVESMKNLAGLTSVQYIFLYPETGDIVLAGPAEGWGYEANGWPVGAESNAPTLQLDDLVTVLRTFSEGGMNIFGCSINPRQQGMKDLKEFAEASLARGPLSASGTRRWAHKLQEKLGKQDIQIYGVPATSRVARVIVEADYRMKMIGIGKMDAGPQIPDYFDLMSKSDQKATGKLDALRWWLTMKYSDVLHSQDKNTFEIRGASVLCQSENQFVTSQGQRVQTGKSEETNRLFAANFTQNYEKLAERDNVFADMQNVFDLALVAALLRNERAADRLGWDMGVFANDGNYQTAVYDAPKEVDSVVNYRVFRNRDVVVQVAGGVRADLMSVVKSKELVKSAPRLENVSKSAQAPTLPEGRWWWDVSN